MPQDAGETQVFISRKNVNEQGPQPPTLQSPMNSMTVLPSSVSMYFLIMSPFKLMEPASSSN